MKTIIKRFLPYAVIISAFCALTYAAVQQSYRQGANDPQIQIAEDTANALADGQSADALVPAAKVDAANSLAPFIIVYDVNGNEVASSVQLDGQTPSLPGGVLDSTKSIGENRVTWQPRDGVRIAAVIVAYDGGYVLAGRNLREVEAREDQVFQFARLTWVLAMAATFITIAFGEWFFKV